MINVLKRSLNFCILPIKIDITKMLVEDLNDPWYGQILVRQRDYRYKTKYIQNKEKLFTQIELLTVCLFVDPNYPNHPNHPKYPNYPNHLGLFQTLSSIGPRNNILSIHVLYWKTICCKKSQQFHLHLTFDWYNPLILDLVFTESAPRPIQSSSRDVRLPVWCPVPMCFKQTRCSRGCSTNTFIAN